MTVETLYETVLKPYYDGEVRVYDDGKLCYAGHAKQRRIYAWLMAKEVKRLYPGKDGELVVLTKG